MASGKRWTIVEVCADLGISRATLYRWRAAGLVPEGEHEYQAGGVAPAPRYRFPAKNRVVYTRAQLGHLRRVRDALATGVKVEHVAATLARQ